MEYLVGDGPNNRYALICCECHSHNGMALRDEFEYISFRCAYCFHLNPARRKKSSPKQSLEDIATASQDDSSLPVIKFLWVDIIRYAMLDCNYHNSSYPRQIHSLILVIVMAHATF